jgi:uncharacterized membrane protein SpoIIM required for sporulation
MMARLRQVYTRDLPRLVKELRWLLLIVLGLYLAGCVVGYRQGETAGYGLGAVPLRLPRWMFPLANARIWGTDGWLHYFAHNTLTAVYTVLWGTVSLGLLSLCLVWHNGCSVGLGLVDTTGMAQTAAGVGVAGTAVAALLPHGLLEIPAFSMIWALGLRAGLVWLRPLPGLRRWQSARAVLREFRTVLLVVVPLLLAAALVETYATPLIQAHFLLGIGASPAMAREQRVGRPFVIGEVSLSPDGETFAATGAVSNAVWIGKRSEAARGIDTGEAYHLASPAWSPDGRHLAFIQGHLTHVSRDPWRSELKTVDVATRRTQVVPGGPRGRYQQAAWRPGEARVGVLVTTSTSPPRATNLWLVDPVTGRWEQLTHFARYGLDTGGFSWSADGKQIVLVRPRSPKSESTQLWVMNADGTSLRKLTNGNRDRRPAWSLDGKWIAFLSVPPSKADSHQLADLLPLAQICLVRPDGSGRREGLAKADDYSTLSWSSDSKQLLYVRQCTAIMGTPKGL